MLRALVVTNMYPTERDPALGSFVRDQVEALRRLPDLDVELFAFRPGGRAYLDAARALRRRYRGRRFDVVHAHFGLSAWPALAVRATARIVTLHGTDLQHPRSGRVTRAALRFVTLPAAVSASLARLVPDARGDRPVAVLPCGVDLARFRPLPRAQARARLGLHPDEPCLLFPADPARPEKRHDRALAAAGGVRLVCGGRIPPAEMPLWVNAANAVLVPSEREGFGLATLEALACEVPVLATPVGIAPLALSGVEGTLCAPFDADAWSRALAPHLADRDPRVAGRPRAELFSAERMAARVAATWRALPRPNPLRMTAKSSSANRATRSSSRTVARRIPASLLSTVAAASRPRVSATLRR